jgi:hypothetical protein
MDKVTVDAGALRQVLQALTGPGHLIRELQVTRGMPGSDPSDNPIDQLTIEFNAAVEKHNEAIESAKFDENNPTSGEPLPGVRCGVCKGPVWGTPSGALCANGHGGYEEDGEPETEKTT